MPLQGWRLTEEKINSLSTENAYLFGGMTFADPEVSTAQLVDRFLLNIDDDGSNNARTLKKELAKKLTAEATPFDRELLGTYLNALDHGITPRLHLASMEEDFSGQVTPIIWDRNSGSFRPYSFDGMPLGEFLQSGRYVVQLNARSTPASRVLNLLRHELGHLRHIVISEFDPVSLAFLNKSRVKYLCEEGPTPMEVGTVREWFHEQVANAWAELGNLTEAELHTARHYASLDQYLQGSGIDPRIISDLTGFQKLLFARNLGFLLPVSADLQTRDTRPLVEIARQWSKAGPS
jgi:hypothetical protein